MMSGNPMSHQEIEQLLSESREIAEDWNTYIQFCRNRQAILDRFVTLSPEDCN
jgi:hypothetical protein